MRFIAVLEASAPGDSHLAQTRPPLQPPPHVDSACLVIVTGITNATLVVKGPGRPWPEETLEGLGAHTSVTDLELLLNSRSDYAHMHRTLSGLHLLPTLKHLHLRLIVSRTPKKGGWPAFFASSLDVHQLEALTVQSTNMPDIALLVRALCMPCMPTHHHVLPVALPPSLLTASQLAAAARASPLASMHRRSAGHSHLAWLPGLSRCMG